MALASALSYLFFLIPPFGRFFPPPPQQCIQCQMAGVLCFSSFIITPTAPPSCFSTQDTEPHTPCSHKAASPYMLTNEAKEPSSYLHFTTSWAPLVPFLIYCAHLPPHTRHIPCWAVLGCQPLSKQVPGRLWDTATSPL